MGLLDRFKHKGTQGCFSKTFLKHRAANLAGMVYYQAEGFADLVPEYFKPLQWRVEVEKGPLMFVSACALSGVVLDSLVDDHLHTNEERLFLFDRYYYYLSAFTETLYGAELSKRIDEMTAACIDHNKKHPQADVEYVAKWLAQDQGIEDVEFLKWASLCYLRWKGMVVALAHDRWNESDQESAKSFSQLPFTGS